MDRSHLQTIRPFLSGTTSRRSSPLPTLNRPRNSNGNESLTFSASPLPLKRYVFVLMDSTVLNECCCMIQVDQRSTEPFFSKWVRVDACVWIFRLPGLVPIHVHHPTSKVHAGPNGPLPLCVFQDMVFQKQGADVSLDNSQRFTEVSLYIRRQSHNLPCLFIGASSRLKSATSSKSHWSLLHARFSSLSMLPGHIISFADKMP